jgi:uncharacterized protein
MLWVIHAEDKPDSLVLRQATRPDHLAYVASFPLELGGPLLDDDGAMCGSLIVLDLPDRMAVEEFVAGDPYTKAGLFDRVSIHAWKQVAPAPADGG